MSCLICEKHKAEFPVIYEGKHFYLSHYNTSPDTPKAYRGHLFVEPKRHVVTVAELTNEEAQEMGQLIAMGGKAVMSVLKPEHLYQFNLGHQVDHLHIHLVPRYKNTPKEFWGGRKLHEWSGADRITEAEVLELVEQLKRATNSSKL